MINLLPDVPPAGHIYGVPVRVSRFLDTPRFELSQKVPVTPEFRRQFEAWAADFFGVDSKALVIQGPPKTIIIGKVAFHRLRKTAQATGWVPT